MYCSSSYKLKKYSLVSVLGQFGLVNFPFAVTIACSYVVSIDITIRYPIFRISVLFVDLPAIPCQLISLFQR